MSKPAKGEMTIRELAERTGMTVRNIRAHQTRGLLPPPVVRGRVWERVQCPGVAGTW